MGFYHGVIPEIKDDIATLRPTVFVAVPRLWNRSADAISTGIETMPGTKGKLARKALRTKLAKCQRTGQYTHCCWDRLVFKKTKARVGGRVRFLVSGSAPLSKDTINFLKVAFCCPMIEGYGLTETLITACTRPEDKMAGIVGGVTVCNELKLVDIPDMDYHSTDKKDGESYPRGEVCYRGPTVFQGYFRQDEKTDEAIDEDGWFHTGDVGELQPNLGLKIIDRMKNIFKL